MPKFHRRDILRVALASAALPGVVLFNRGRAAGQENGARSTKEIPDQDAAMKIHYLEIVTPDVDAACALYSRMHGTTFGEADPNLGGARTAKLHGGGMLGIRAPLRPSEKPVVRPYLLVKDIKAAVAAAAESGAQIAMDPTEIAGYGQFAIIIQGGIESGLWQL